MAHPPNPPNPTRDRLPAPPSQQPPVSGRRPTPKEATVARRSHGPSRTPWLVIATFLVALLVAVGAIWLGASNSTSPSPDLWYEVAKAGLQLFAIALLGGAVAGAFKILDGRREDRRRRDEYLGVVADQLWNAYLRVKAVRRAP